MSRHERITFTVSLEEHQAILSAAFAREQTVADYLRNLVSADIQKPLKAPGPGRPREGVYLSIRIEPLAAHRLGHAASRRRVVPRVLAERLIRTICESDLFLAVLDDQQPAQPSNVSQEKQ